MKKLLILLLAIMSTSISYSQTKQKVAVYVTGAEEGINEFMGAYLVDAIVNSSNYLAVERTADFLRELNKEQSS
jgi:stalled ribosome rescue protein Dom34